MTVSRILAFSISCVVFISLPLCTVCIYKSATYGASVEGLPVDRLRFGPDMYCAYCRQRGWHTCIKRYCFGGIAPPSNIAAGDNGNRLPVDSFGFGPDMSCAYCRQRGWHECIKRYCFGGFGASNEAAGYYGNGYPTDFYGNSAMGYGSYGYPSVWFMEGAKYRWS